MKADPARPIPLRKLAEMAAKDQSWMEAATWQQRFLETKPQREEVFAKFGPEDRIVLTVPLADGVVIEGTRKPRVR